MEEVSVKQKHTHINTIQSKGLSSKVNLKAFGLNLCYSLEVKIDDDIIEELSTVKALQVLHCNSYTSF